MATVLHVQKQTFPIFIQKLLNFGCNDKGQHFQDRTERAGKDQPEAEMQRRVTSRGDFDKWQWKVYSFGAQRNSTKRVYMLSGIAAILHAEPVGEGNYVCV